MRRSSPARPWMRSLPPLPSIWSAAFVPRRRSLPGPPMMVAASALAGTSERRSRLLHLELLLLEAHADVSSVVGVWRVRLRRSAASGSRGSHAVLTVGEKSMRAAASRRRTRPACVIVCAMPGRLLASPSCSSSVPARSPSRPRLARTAAARAGPTSSSAPPARPAQRPRRRRRARRAAPAPTAQRRRRQRPASTAGPATTCSSAAAATTRALGRRRQRPARRRPRRRHAARRRRQRPIDARGGRGDIVAGGGATTSSARATARASASPAAPGAIA